MRKIYFLASLAAAALSACSENSMAPSAPPAASASPTQGSTADLAGTDTIRFSMTIDPWHQTSIYLGSGNSLIFPAHSVCDPNTSSYGPTEWDKPCAAATSSVTVNVKAWLDKNGHARADFDKHVRFVPSANPSQWVVLTFADLEASLDPFFNILYCATATSTCVDESKTDPSLVTVRNPVTGKVTRRIKHFSGYNVAAGDDGGDGGDGLMDQSVGDWSSMSVSTSDFNLSSVSDVQSAYPGIGAADAEQMLNRIRIAQLLSGYILASGDQQ